jgi:hypothetical protein
MSDLEIQLKVSVDDSQPCQQPSTSSEAVEAIVAMVKNAPMLMPHSRKRANRE